MDEFGVLTERFGLKPQGKSAPMAAAKRPPAPSATGSFNPMPSSDNFDVFGGFPMDTGSINSKNNFSSNSTRSYPSSFDYFDSVFSGGPSPNNLASGRSSFDDDIFSGSVGGNNLNDDVFGPFVSKPKQSSPDGDLLGGFGFGPKLKPPPAGRNGSSPSVGFDDLIPGFGSSSSGGNMGMGKSSFASSDDPFVVLESMSTTVHSTFINPLDEFSIFSQSGGQQPSKSSNASPSLKPPPKPGQVLKADKVKTSGVSSIDELEDFAMLKVRNNAGKEARERQSGKASKYKEAEDAAQKTQQKSADDLETLFSMGSRSSSVPKSRPMTTDSLFDTVISGTNDKNVSGVSSGMNRVASAGNMVDDFSSLFGDASLFGEFEEVDGESEERRNARLGRQQRTQDRMAKAVADMNKRDLQTQHEQEERRRIAEQMDVVIKCWAAGKEANLRKLLSSLHQVLWPECGWEAVSLTDIVTSASVKKVFRKATLCVHPDKVQQKGATLHEKYIAEKVFDILKEAWNKFNRDELR